MAELEILPGETVEQAVMRLAVAIEQDQQQEKPKKARAKKEPKVTVSDPSAGEEVDPLIYSAIHIYQRPGEPDGAVRSNGTRERSMHGPNTIVVVHLHHFGEACTPACRERVAQ